MKIKVFNVIFYFDTEETKNALESVCTGAEIKNSEIDGAKYEVVLNLYEMYEIGSELKSRADFGDLELNEELKRLLEFVEQYCY